MMIEIAPNVFQIPVMPRQMINAYLIGSVLIDAGIKSSGKTLLKAIGSRKLTAHALTHAHPDHQGASALICERLGLPFWPSSLVASASRAWPVARLSKSICTRSASMSAP